jgi:hypothetical protein
VLILGSWPSNSCAAVTSVAAACTGTPLSILPSLLVLFVPNYEGFWQEVADLTCANCNVLAMLVCLNSRCSMCGVGGLSHDIWKIVHRLKFQRIRFTSGEACVSTCWLLAAVLDEHRYMVGIPYDCVTGHMASWRSPVCMCLPSCSSSICVSP